MPDGGIREMRGLVHDNGDAKFGAERQVSGAKQDLPTLRQTAQDGIGEVCRVREILGEECVGLRDHAGNAPVGYDRTANSRARFVQIVSISARLEPDVKMRVQCRVGIF